MPGHCSPEKPKAATAPHPEYINAEHMGNCYITQQRAGTDINRAITTRAECTHCTRTPFSSDNY